MGVIAQEMRLYVHEQGLTPAKWSTLQARLMRRTEVQVRTIVERFEHASLDAKADREALIKALVEALT